MVLSERIKQARIARGLNQRELAFKAGVSAMAISKYERSEDIPSSGVLIRLAKALNVKVEFFLRPIRVTIGEPSYRKRKRLPEKAMKALLAKVQDWVERYIEVESLFWPEGSPAFRMPRGFPKDISALEDVEHAAIELREKWKIGLDSIENLTELLEDKGLKVGVFAGHEAFDALTIPVNGEIAIITKSGTSGDRQRMNISHELGHLMLKRKEGIDSEKLAYRFAAAFLVPRPIALSELSEKRHRLDLRELHLLKHKYGLSMQAWIGRARDLRIISESAYARFHRDFRAQGWHVCEPGDQLEMEKPTRMQRLILKALAEDMISETRASELLGKPLSEFIEEMGREHGGLAPANSY
jgi:transcriptional regulator with XRE-family HTH domain